MAASGAEHSEFEISNYYILNLLFFWKKKN